MLALLHLTIQKGTAQLIVCVCVSLFVFACARVRVCVHASLSACHRFLLELTRSYALRAVNGASGFVVCSSSVQRRVSAVVESPSHAGGGDATPTLDGGPEELQRDHSTLGERLRRSPPTLRAV